MSYFLIFRNSVNISSLPMFHNDKSSIIPISNCQEYVINMISNFWEIDESIYAFSDRSGGDQCDEIIEKANEDYILKSIDFCETYFYRFISWLLATRSEIIFWYGENSLKKVFHVSNDSFLSVIKDYVNGTNTDYESTILIHSIGQEFSRNGE